ncbi:cupin domain-containing protein [Oceanobacillus rekensis]|uniref:cupin domain-containing protein n=1 Tax=Oceanobacillus rekensis TaxID=937927 RepID=UPI000B43ED90|nr:cupin domain-containing protein [Oceanobacillus rekensis]
MDKYLITEAQQFDEKRFTKINIIHNKRSVAFLLNFLPDQHMKSHNHPDRELYLHVIQGSGQFLINGEELEVGKGDVIYCGEEEQIGFTNTGEENVSIFATMTKLSD